MNPNELTIDDLVDYAPPHCFEEDFPLTWQMTRAERFSLLHIIKVFKPELSLEIGTSKGGSLQVLSRFSKEVVSVDIDPGVESNLKDAFPNVAFKSGDSSALLPQLVGEINNSDKAVGLVLIDGDHSEHGVYNDINSILQLKPKRPVAILMHDSFNPPCRRGMLGANWHECPNVHYVEIDFVGGILVPGRKTADESMVGGFGFALMLPERRQFELKIFESQAHKFGILNRVADNSDNMGQRFMKHIMTSFGQLKSRLRYI